MIDRYFFLGILEEGQCCVDTLAEMIGKKKIILSRHNETDANLLTDRKSLPQDMVAKFKEENSLDYLIYNYAYSKFNKLKEKLQADVC